MLCSKEKSAREYKLSREQTGNSELPIFTSGMLFLAFSQLYSSGWLLKK